MWSKICCITCDLIFGRNRRGNLILPIPSARKQTALLRDVAKSPQQLDEENRKPSFLLQINCRALIDENPSHILLLCRREKATKSGVLEGLPLLAVSALYGLMEWGECSSHFYLPTIFPCRFLATVCILLDVVYLVPGCSILCPFSRKLIKILTYF
jgi:hypothetical protein